MFQRILIANRGEIAARIARTCRTMGIASVGVHSWADRASLHTRAVDASIALGPSAASLSYLDIDRVIDAARRTAVDAVHPGYGFLSENAEFAARCEDAGMCWIGPSAEVIRLMGDKGAARQHVAQAGVPIVPGFRVESADDTPARCEKLGYPVLVKAAAGGGGRGLRRVNCASELGEALQSARREAESAFGDGALLVEKYVSPARHVEVQILADRHGHTVHLFERDCSLQRRHQKVIEEAPAPGLQSALRERLTAAACLAASSVGYANAGTVEFLVGPDDDFYFIEMNTRLQVEHPVTECITGLDLVEWQLRIAAGEPLNLRQEDISVQGHAIEARVCAEDPEQEFRPQPGLFPWVRWPEGEGLRVDTAVQSGDQVSAHYDSLIAKIIATGSDREEACARLEAALRRLEAAGPVTNARFLVRCLENREFRNGRFDTGFIAEHLDDLVAPDATLDDETLVIAAFAVASADAGSAGGDPWRQGDSWRSADGTGATYYFAQGGKTVPVTTRWTGRFLNVLVGGQKFVLAGTVSCDGRLEVRIGTETVHGRAVVDDAHVWLFLDSGQWTVVRPDRAVEGAGRSGGTGDFASPMPGRVTEVRVGPGDRVAAGATLLVVEAMKIEHRIQAPGAGLVKALRCEQGAWVTEGEMLVEFVPETT